MQGSSMGSIFAAIKRLSEESQPIIGLVKRPAVVFVTCQPSKNTSSSSLPQVLIPTDTESSSSQL